MFEKIKEVILQYSDVSEAEITEESRFVSDLGLDSLRIAAMLVDIEEQFNITIAMSDVSNFKCIKDVMNYMDYSATA